MRPTGTPSHIATEPTAIRTIVAALPKRPSGFGSSACDALEDVGVDVEVRVDGVDIVLILQGIDELQELRRAVLVERHAGLRLLRALGGLDADAGLVERGADRGQVGRLAEDLEDVIV